MHFISQVLFSALLAFAIWLFAKNIIQTQQDEIRVMCELINK